MTAISDAVANSPSTGGARGEACITYDANGNILKYLRNSIKPNQVKMDSLTYSYYPNTNQLRRIKDSVPDNLFYDPENQIVDINSQSDSNYVYDSIGNLVMDKQENIDTIKWNVYGKISEIVRRATDTVPASNIKYTYDAMGNRISQVVTSNGTKYYTWYVRDAQGNILSTYSAQGNASLESLELQLADRFMYGSSRLGTITVNDNNVDGGPGNTEYYYEDKKIAYDRGYKSYELTNHLGNVLATVSDRKFGVSSGGSSLISYYNPHIVTAQDYYPFGMVSRVNLNGKSYRFGFNGQEINNDVKGGLGNSYTAQYWEYDSRIGRRWNMDPVYKEYESPYAVFGNNPIWNIDPDGADTAKTSQIEGKDLTAAAKTAASMVSKLLKEKKLNTKTSEDEDKQLVQSALDYAKKNNLSIWGAFKYYGVLKSYYRGLEDMAWWRGSDFTTVNNDIIQNDKLDDFTRLSKMEGKISASSKEMVDVVSMGGKTALWISSLALFPNVGPGPKGIQTAPSISLSADMGKIIGWGTGQTALAAQTTRNITSNLTRAQVQAFANQGVTKQWVQKQLSFYGKAVLDPKKVSKNVNLLPRKELMEKILYLWPK